LRTSNNENYYIGIDLGTTHIKAAVFDSHGSLKELLKESTPIATDEFGQIYDPIRFYDIVRDQLSTLLQRYERISGISITGMSEAGLIMNRHTCIEETPILPWFDKRTVKLSEQVSKEEEISNFYSTGLRNNYKYGIYKYLWLLSYYDIKKEDSIWLSVCDYIVWKLTGQFISDPSFAARTYVYDIINRCWDKRRLSNYGLSEYNFPKVISSGEMVGYLSDNDLLLKTGKKSIIVGIGGHDHVCAAYAVLNDDTDRICNSVGTAETFLGIDEHLSISEDHYNSGMIYGPYVNGKDCFWMANISSSGQSIEWFRKNIQQIQIGYAEMNEMISSMPDEPTNILYYPFLSGIGTPLFLPDIGGGFFGLKGTHNTSDLLKAVIEGINYQGKWILSLVPDKEHSKIKDVICVGGATNSIPWMQMKANILGIPISVPPLTEATLLGAVAIMIDKNYGSDRKQNFLLDNQNQNLVFEVNQVTNKKYHEIYDKYKFLIDKILK